VNTPPTPQELKAAMTRLPVAPSLAVALHLALPKCEVPSVSVRVRLGELYYRDAHIVTAANVYVTASRLAALGHQAADEYLDLSEDTNPHSWVKVIKSGSRMVAFGTTTLFAAPEISLIPGVRLAALESALCGLQTGELKPPTMIDDGTGRQILIEGNTKSLLLVPA
jgi:hypothetical protein